MRLINADALYETLCHVWDRSDGEEFERSVFKVIANAPPIDAIPVVRCKDCKYAKLFEDRDGLCGHPSNNAWDIFDEFYCGRGVKHELVE